ncbi:MAG: recombinase RecA, partial [bacterium]
MTKEAEAAVAAIHKKFGETAIMKMGDKREMDIEVISSGNAAIDRALGVGGLPKGRIVEIFGPESS